MCTPAIGAVVGILGTGLQVVGGLQQAKAAEAQARYQAAIAHNNQIIANRNADDSRKRGEEAAQEQLRKTSALQGRQRAVMAAFGLDIASGSPLDVLEDTASYGTLDALTIKNNAERQAIGYSAQAMNFEAEGNMANMRASSIRSAAPIQAFSTALGGFQSVASNWYRSAGVGSSSYSAYGSYGV